MSGCRRETEILPANAASVIRAVEVLRAGGLVAFPTDTIYGVAALAWDEAAEAAVQGQERPAKCLSE